MGLRLNIRVYSDINESHVATGYGGRTDLPAFHIFTVEDTYPQTHAVMHPYRFDFYQIVLLENSNDASLNMNAAAVPALSNSLTFASPAHVLAWVRGQAQRGFIIYFKSDFLAPFPIQIENEFPYFRLNEVNYVRVMEAEKSALREQCQKLLDLFNSDHPYRVAILQALLLALLYDCKRLNQQEQEQMKRGTPGEALAIRFQAFVNQQFLTHKTVESYAELLNVSTDYLGQTVKKVTGKTVHHIIAERVLLEARKLLLYSDLTIAEIADYLGYSEATHFGRFFRQQTGTSPLVWRKTQRR